MSDFTLTAAERRIIETLRRERIQPFALELALRAMPQALKQIGELHGYALGAEMERAVAEGCEWEADEQAWTDRIDEINRLTEQAAALLGRIAAQPDPAREVEQ